MHQIPGTRIMGARQLMGNGNADDQSLRDLRRRVREDLSSHANLPREKLCRKVSALGLTRPVRNS